MNTIGILMERPWNLWIFLTTEINIVKIGIVYSINYTNAQEWEVFPFSSVFLFFFLKCLKVFTLKVFPLLVRFVPKVIVVV